MALARGQEAGMGHMHQVGELREGLVEVGQLQDVGELGEARMKMLKRMLDMLNCSGPRFPSCLPVKCIRLCRHMGKSGNWKLQTAVSTRVAQANTSHQNTLNGFRHML